MNELKNKILQSIVRSIRTVDNEFSNIKKQLELLDDNTYTDFAKVADDFSAFYTNRLAFKHSMTHTQPQQHQPQKTNSVDLDSSQVGELAIASL